MSEIDFKELIGNKKPTKEELKCVDRKLRNELLICREKIKDIVSMLDEIDRTIELHTYYLE